MSSFQTTFTGLFDTDLLIIKEIDNPFFLIDLYRTHEYIHILLNSEEALKIISCNYNLPIVCSFQELIEAYESKLIAIHPYDQVLDIAINYDNVRLLKKCLNNIELPNHQLDEFTDEEEEFIDKYYAVVLSAGQKSIQRKSYNCLTEIGSYLIFAIKVKNPLYYKDSCDNGEYLRKLLITAVDNDDYAAIDIVLSWNIEPIKPVDVNSELYAALQRASEIDGMTMYDYILKKENRIAHHSKNILLKAILKKNLK
jgi:hypothetical protein